jgi:hypothetical protein
MLSCLQENVPTLTFWTHLIVDIIRSVYYFFFFLTYFLNSVYFLNFGSLTYLIVNLKCTRDYLGLNFKFYY